MATDQPVRRGEELERELLEEVEKTRAQYEAVKRQYEDLTAVHTDVGTTPDGLCALRTATMLKRHAASAYSRALSRFSAFIIDKKIPGLSESDRD